MNSIPGGSYGQRTLAPEQMPKKKNIKKKIGTGIRSVFGPVKKESIFSQLKKSFPSVLKCKKFNEQSIYLCSSMKNVIPSNKLSKYSMFWIDQEFSEAAVDAAKKVDYQGKEYNKLLAHNREYWNDVGKAVAERLALDLKTKEMLDKVVKKQRGINNKHSRKELADTLEKLNSRVENGVRDLKDIANQISCSLEDKEIDLNSAKRDFKNRLSSSMGAEVMGRKNKYDAAVKGSEEYCEKEKNRLAIQYNKDFAELEKSIKCLSNEKEAAVMKKDNDKKSIKEAIKGESREESKDAISALKTAISTGRVKIAQCESQLKENRSQLDKLKKINKKEIKYCDQENKKNLKKLHNEWEITIKMIRKKYEKLYFRACK